MVGAILGPAVRQSPCCAFPPLLATTEERGENVCIGLAQTLLCSSLRGNVALAAAGGGAD